MAKRIVRKEEPFLTRFKENPEDIWMTATDNIQTIWNVMYRYLGWILWRLFYIFIVLHKALTIQSVADDKYEIPSVSWKEIVILLGSLYLTWNCFMHYKDYQFFSRPDFKGPPSDTRNFHLADRVPEGPPGWAETGVGRLMQVLELQLYTDNYIHKHLFLISYLSSRYSIYAKFFAQPETSDQIWVLRTWEPRRYFLRCFCWFSPAQLLMYHIMTPGKAIYLSAAILTTAFFLRKLVDMFDAMVQDKQVIYGQVLAEYNENFVAPRAFVPKMSHEVQTQGGFWDTLTEIKLNSKKSKSHRPIHQSVPRHNSSRDYYQQPMPQFNSFGGNFHQPQPVQNNSTENRHRSKSTFKLPSSSSSSTTATKIKDEATLSTPIAFSSSITTSSNITASRSSRTTRNSNSDTNNSNVAMASKSQMFTRPTMQKEAYECPADKPSPYKSKDNIFQYGYGPISDYVEDWPPKNTTNTSQRRKKS
ncbi:3386_t:CDS:2 [Ambispora gerdemannii]|uniref:3386_t:CDS:1 n=1 Tax=Ambispora gerdemannii TaxID=144530 RepID=A0A9N8ZJE7_9GLOM|nr:3386_t:CDS:2 [Ambispora gerdemannii]